jgi:F0F1-type ATP synthase membrane subunit c/vacuolar-type H+-ATPase subunit K
VARARSYDRGVIERLLPYVRPARAAGLALLAAGIVVALAWHAAIGLAVIGAAAVLLAFSQPLLVQRARTRAGRRAAPLNGHSRAAEPDDLDLPT